MTEHPFDYEIIYSSRRTIAVQVTRDGKIIVRSPQGCSRPFIRNFVSRNEDWVRKHLARATEEADRQ